MDISHTLGSGDYIMIRNSLTGDLACIDKKKSMYKKICQGFLNSLRMKPYVLRHIILTQAVESYQPKIINNFLNCLRRYYGDILYIWSVEVQEERFKNYGDRVLHWHLIVAFEDGTEIAKDDILRMQKYWKYGSCRIRPVYSVSLSYLTKYISKALDCPLESQYKLRRIGTSRIEGWLKQSIKRILEAYDWFKKWYSDKGIDCLSDFYWFNGNAYLWDEWELGGHTGRRKEIIYKKADWGWRVVDQLQGEPF